MFVFLSTSQIPSESSLTLWVMLASWDCYLLQASILVPQVNTTARRKRNRIKQGSPCYTGEMLDLSSNEPRYPLRHPRRSTQVYQQAGRHWDCLPRSQVSPGSRRNNSDNEQGEWNHQILNNYLKILHHIHIHVCVWRNICIYMCMRKNATLKIVIGTKVKNKWSGSRDSDWGHCCNPYRASSEPGPASRDSGGQKLRPQVEGSD